MNDYLSLTERQLISLIQIMGKEVSYPELCDVLGFSKAKKTSTKENQLTLIRKYATLTDNGKKNKGLKYIVTDVSLKTEEEKQQATRTSIYRKYLKPIILYTLYNSISKKIETSKNGAMQKFGMVSNGMKLLKQHPQASSKVLGVGISSLKYFSENETNKNINVLNSTLDELDREKLIKYHKPLYFVYEDGTIKEQSRDIEDEIFDNIETKVLEKYECEDVQSAYKKGFLKQINAECLKKVQEKYGCTYYFKGYKILLNEYGIKKIIEKGTYENAMIELQNALLSKHKDSYKKIHEKRTNNPKYEMYRETDFKQSSYFVDDMFTLCDFTILNNEWQQDVCKDIYIEIKNTDETNDIIKESDKV